jgi:hypothetical protein
MYASDEEMLNDVFEHHAPTPEQRAKYEELRPAAKEFARVIMALCPPCADRSAALRKLREAVMTANASIALNGNV